MLLSLRNPEIMLPGIRANARARLWYVTLASIIALLSCTRGADLSENASGVYSKDISFALSQRQSSTVGEISSIPASLLSDSSRNASSSVIPVASSASGDRFSFVLSQGSDVDGTPSVLIQKIDLSSRLVLWSAEYFNLGTPLGVCAPSLADNSEAESLFFGKEIASEQ